MDHVKQEPMGKKTWDSIDAYIQSFPEDIQEKLRAIRALVQTIVPEATAAG